MAVAIVATVAIIKGIEYISSHELLQRRGISKMCITYNGQEYYYKGMEQAMMKLRREISNGFV